MIVSFRNPDTQRIFEGRRSGKIPPSLHRGAMRKLWMLDAATAINDLRVPPGNRLEKLADTFAGRHSIRINDQWRICFRWEHGNVHDVEIIDYH
ncbi:MAG: type II toxin-antitoxin system RelE/ParE family toxin [Patescibacteria group bacterium]